MTWQRPPSRATPRVVMLVANDIATDSRVKREALSVARLGLDVIVLATTSEQQPSVAKLGAVTVLRLPVPHRLRDARLRRRRAARQWRPHVVGYRRPEDRAAAWLRAQVTAQEGRVRRGGRAGGKVASRLPGRRDLSAKRQSTTIRLRLLTHRLGDAGLRRGWRAWDAAWARLPVGAQWRRLLPEVYDFELAFGPVLDDLAPDVIHAHDMHMVSIADNATRRAAIGGAAVPWVYDAHEYVRGLSQYGGRTPRVVAAWADLEKEYIRSAARIITVSEPIAAALVRDHRLTRRPEVVLNIPSAAAVARAGGQSIRAACALADDVPLLIYSGGMTRARGVHTTVAAMRQLPGAHLALTCVPHAHTAFVEQLRRQAKDDRVADRVHFLDPVGPGDVVAFLASGDVGVFPVEHFPSHELTLSNKLFEYMHAGLPIISSDVRGHRDFVLEHRIGEVFVAGDAADLARAAKAVLSDKARYVAAITDPALRATYSWAGQEEVLRSVYEELLGMGLAPSDASDLAVDEGTIEEPVTSLDGRDPVAALAPRLAHAGPVNR